MVETKMLTTDFGRKVSFTTDFDIMTLSESMVIKSLEVAAKQIAERFVEENYIKIAALIDPQAIANLAIANAAAEISKTIKGEAATKTRIIESVKTEVYQRSFLGGITRVK